MKWTYTANINTSDTEHLGPLPDLGYLLRSLLCFLDAAADDTSIRAEVDKSACLGAADGPSSACDKDDTVG